MDENELYKKFYKNKDEKAKEAFDEMYAERKKHKDALRERLKKYALSEAELDDLFKIITKAEIEIEELKSQQTYKETYSAEELNKFGFKIFDIQHKMRKDFDAKLKKIVNKKIEDAKKIINQKNKMKQDLISEELNKMNFETSNIENSPLLNNDNDFGQNNPFEN